MRLPSVTLAGLAFLELNAQHAGPEAKGLLGVIGRKLHQGDRMPRHGVKTHTRRIVALVTAARIWQSESVGTYVQQIPLAALVEPSRTAERPEAAQRTTRSVVGFAENGERLVGRLARRQLILAPKKTIYSAKRFIGRRFDEVPEWPSNLALRS